MLQVLVELVDPIWNADPLVDFSVSPDLDQLLLVHGAR
jgi:hypothetical protein